MCVCSTTRGRGKYVQHYKSTTAYPSTSTTTRVQFPMGGSSGGGGAILGVRTSPPFEGPPINVTHMKTPHFSNAVSPPVILYPPQFCMSVSLSSRMSYVKLKKLPCRLQGDKGFFQWGGGGIQCLLCAN